LISGDWRKANGEQWWPPVFLKKPSRLYAFAYPISGVRKGRLARSAEQGVTEDGEASSNKDLAAGFQQHLEQTKEHAQRLQQILKNHQQTTRWPWSLPAATASFGRSTSIPAAEVQPSATSGNPLNGRMRTLLYEIYLAKIELFA
jgi:Domain of unknown function (DUF892)